jgi:hypothetical protein
MFKRLMIASIGAIIVTIALLLMMNRAANHLAIQDPVQYFGIADFIPYTGTRRPPPLPQLQPRPELPPLEAEDAEDAETAPVERPQVTMPAMELPPSDLAQPVPDEPAAR